MQIIFSYWIPYVPEELEVGAVHPKNGVEKSRFFPEFLGDVFINNSCRDPKLP